MSKSVFVSAMGVLTGFVTDFVNAFKKRGGTDEQLHELFVGKKSDEFISQLVDLAMKMVQSVRDGFHIVVDYGKSLADMIKAGHYDWFNSDISEEHFSVMGSGKVESDIQLIHYGKYMESDDIIQDLENRGLRPATVAELAAFGSTYPDKQREFSIVALGSVWRDRGGGRYVACLCSGASGRGLSLCSWGGGWDGGCRFAAVCK